MILGLSYVLMAKLRPVPAASGGNLPVFLLDFFEAALEFDPRADPGENIPSQGASKRGSKK